MNEPLTTTSLRERTSDLLRKILITLSTSGLVFLITILVDGTPLWTITISVFVGGVALVVQYLVDFEDRLGAVESTQAKHFAKIEQLLDDKFGIVERLVDEKFSRINEATELFGLVEASQLRTDLVTQLVRHSTRLNPASHQLIHDFAQSEIARMSDFMKELGEGQDITYDGEDRDWLLGLTRTAQLTIDAISLNAVDARGKGFDDGSLWSSDLGQRYLEEQRDAIQRDVTIRRVFVLDRSDRISDPELIHICKLQQEVGIQVRVLDPALLPTTRKTSMFDFILFDDVVSYESTPAAWSQEGVRPVIVHTRLVLRQHRVTERVQRFRDLWAAARELS